MSEKITNKSAVFIQCAKCHALQRLEFEVTSETVKQEKVEPKEEKKKEPAKETDSLTSKQRAEREKAEANPAKDVKE